MLPIPYIKVEEAVIEFNAKITSSFDSSTADTFSNQTNSSGKGRSWFSRVRSNTTTSYQKENATKNNEERSFDMHIEVTASNADMPEGTARILNMIEESMGEAPGVIDPIILTVDGTAAATELEVTSGNLTNIKAGMFVNDQGSNDITVTEVNVVDKILKFSGSVTPDVDQKISID